MIISYPNSKFITVKKEKVEPPFIYASNKNVAFAMKDLSNSCFKVYICLIMNKDGYMATFSPANISSITGLHPDTVRKCFAELEMKKYILRVEGTEAHYVFYDTVQLKKYAPREAAFSDKAEQEYPSFFN